MLDVGEYIIDYILKQNSAGHFLIVDRIRK